MMCTLHMLIHKLNPSLIADASSISRETITSIRILTEEDMRDQTLYLSDNKGGVGTLLQTKKGASVIYLADTVSTLNTLLGIMEYYRDWEKEFSDASRRGYTLTELLDFAYPMLSYPLIILDNHEWMVACSSVLKMNSSRLNQDLSEMLLTHTSATEKIADFNKRFHYCFKNREVYKIPGELFTDNGYAFNLFHDRKLSGILLMELFDNPAIQGDLDIFQLVGEHIQSMLNDPSSGLSIGTEDTTLNDYLKNPDEKNQKRIHHELQVSSWKDSDSKQVIFISPPSSQSLSPNLNHALLMFNRLFALKAVEFNNGIVLLLNRRMLSENSGYDAIIQRINQLAYCAGVSNDFSDTTEIPLMVQRAIIALQKGDKRSGAVNYFKDHFLQYLFSMFRKEDADILEHPLLEKLKHHDKRYGSHLYHTLLVFLENERSISRTSLALNIHRSTMIHRIERIEEMAQGILDNPETRMHILVSYYLKQSHFHHGE